MLALNSNTQTWWDPPVHLLPPTATQLLASGQHSSKGSTENSRQPLLAGAAAAQHAPAARENKARVSFPLCLEGLKSRAVRGPLRGKGEGKQLESVRRPCSPLSHQLHTHKSWNIIISDCFPLSASCFLYVPQTTRTASTTWSLRFCKHTQAETHHEHAAERAALACLALRSPFSPELCTGRRLYC